MNQPDHQPSVLFVCVHNAGPSQMGAACATYLSGGAVEVRSQGPRRPNRWGGADLLKPTKRVGPSKSAASAWTRRSRSSRTSRIRSMSSIPRSEGSSVALFHPFDDCLQTIRQAGDHRELVIEAPQSDDPIPVPHVPVVQDEAPGR